MDRRWFLTRALTGGALLLTGCRQLVSTQPDGLNPGKVHYELPPGEGGGGDTTVLLTVAVGAASMSVAVPRSRTMTVGQALDWAQAHAGLDVGFGIHPTRGRYVNRLLNTSVTASSVPTLLYAVGASTFSTEDAWYGALAGSYVDSQSAPAVGGVIDWRLAIP